MRAQLNPKSVSVFALGETIGRQMYHFPHFGYRNMRNDRNVNASLIHPSFAHEGELIRAHRLPIV